MNLGEALDLVVARTGNPRFRELLDRTHADYDPRWGPIVLAMAAEAQADPATSPAEPPRRDARLDLVRTCPHRGSELPHTMQPPCGCKTFTLCQAGRGPYHRAGAVTLAECLACVSSPRPPFLFHL
jgi:hypothetical protein